MRIVQLTPGTGSFYCGTCLRDNALVVELRRQGHDALLVPLYLPLVVDEALPERVGPLFYGGIKIYLQQKFGGFRAAPRWLDRLLDAPSLLAAAARRAGMTSPRDLGDLTLSMLRGEAGHQAKELARLTDWLVSEIHPEAVCLSTALLVGMARQIRARTGARLVCALAGEDAFLDSLPEPTRREAWELVAERASDVDAFVAVSRYFADVMIHRARLPADRVHVVYPGIRLDGFEPAPAPPEPPVIGYLARMIPGKGLGTLVDAFIRLREAGAAPRAKLRVAGACTAADLPFVRALQQRLRTHGLEGDAEFLPNLSREAKIAFLRGLTLLSVPATYGEAFGLYVLEANAVGVPVVQPRHGAFPEVLAATGGGVLCEPDDPASLAEALARLLADPEAARALGRQGRDAVQRRFTAERMARETLAVITGEVAAPII